MMNLVPEWAREQPEFWEAIRGRNLWFIKLRYGFVVALIVFILIATIVLKIDFSIDQLIAVTAITASIFFYNVLLHRLRKYVRLEVDKFNPMYLSLLQMVLDLFFLLLLVYFTGGIESPLYMLFIFHMLIGSLILPGSVVYSVATIFVILFASMNLLEYFGILQHHHISGLMDFHLYDKINFVAAFVSTFAFMIFVSIYLSNGIARQLYKREKDLVESIKKINAAEKEKQKYIMGIVHELKTPIVAVAAYIDIILQKFLGPLDETIEEKLTRAKYRTDEGIQMINDVLNVSKLNLYDKFDEEDVDIRLLINGVIRRRKAYADAHLIKMNFKDARSASKKVKGDKFLLDIAVSNLIGNAIKYGVDEGRVEVTLTDEKNNLIIEVCDDGVGIPEEEITKIFKDFYRAENVKKISTEGSGLGLSVVKKIIDRHDGIISVKSPSRLRKKDQPGSCFTIKLPYERKETPGPGEEPIKNIRFDTAK
jgi:signal transduction histidine kinase